MASRTTKVTLVAEVSQYLVGMEKAARATRETGTEAEKLAQKRQAMEGLGRSMLVFGAVAAAGVAIAVAKFAEFDQAMSQVNAVTQETAANQALLRDAALEAGGRTIYTATEAANAIEELGKAGLATTDILSGGLNGALDLAASGQLEVARAAEITATTLKQYNLAGDQAGRVADVLSAGAGKALGSVEDLAQGLKFVGPVANAMGVSLEETTAVLALFADQGIIGEQAGTSLRGMLSSLTSPSSQARKEIDRLGITLYDTEGNFLGLQNAAGQLNNAYGDLDGASRDASLGIIFGNQQLTAANVLASQGADAVAEYTDAVNESGYAARVAADRLDNLAGDVEKLGGAFDTALIKSGSGANDVLRSLVQSATFLVDGFSELPQPAIDAGLAVGTVAAAVALTGGSALVAIPKIAEMRTSMALLGVSGRTAAIGVASATAALAAVAFVLGSIVTYEAEKKSAIDALSGSFDEVTGSVTDYTRELIAQQLAQEGAIDLGEKLGLSIDEMIDLTLQGKGAVAEWADARRAANAEDAAAVAQYDAVAGGLEIVSGRLDDGRKAWERERAATESSRKASEEKSDALAVLEGRAAATTDEINQLSEAILGFGSATLDSRQAEREFQAAIDDATQSIIDNGATLDVNTDAGRANEAALDAIVDSAKEVAAATYERTGSEDEAAAAVQRGRDALLEQLATLGITGDAANAYADDLGLIPENISTFIAVNTADAEYVISEFLAKPRYLGVSLMGLNPVDTYGNETGGMWSKGVKEFATGGFESGIYRGGQNIHKFAETGLPWETYISPKPGYERENIGYALESLNRLGFQMPQSQAPSLDGLAITGRLEIGGDGIAMLVDAHIEQNDSTQRQTAAQGWRGI